MIVWPDQAVDESGIGGKAAHLFRMHRAGLPVPGAFSVPFDVPDRSLDTGVERALVRLGPGAVAVRSSAEAEDTHAASAAGIYRSHLQVTGRTEVVRAIRDVRDSVTTPEARHYRAAVGLHAEVRMGVIVQRMLAAEATGVLFTRNPVDGGPQMVVESVWGLGTALMGGEVDPDRWILGTGGRIEDRVVARKELQLVAGNDTVIRIAVPEAKRSQPSLSAESLCDLWRLAAQARDVFGYDLDIEWVRSESTIWLIQARPIRFDDGEKGIS